MASFWASSRNKAILAGVLIVIAVVFVARQIWKPGALPSGVRYVCVSTGKVFTLPRDKVNLIPEVNPDTGEHTLLPCSERDGAVRVTSRYRDALVQLGDKNHYVDIETLLVKTP